ARNYEIQIELPDEAHAMSACGIVNAGKSFVEQNQPRCQRVAALAVETGNSGKQWHGEAEGPFPAGGRAGKLAPLTVLPAFDTESVPASIVERARELVDQAATIPLRRTRAWRRCAAATSHRQPDGP